MHSAMSGKVDKEEKRRDSLIIAAARQPASSTSNTSSLLAMGFAGADDKGYVPLLVCVVLSLSCKDKYFYNLLLFFPRHHCYKCLLLSTLTPQIFCPSAARQQQSPPIQRRQQRRLLRRQRDERRLAACTASSTGRAAETQFPDSPSTAPEASCGPRSPTTGMKCRVYEVKCCILG
jgi:hypothetical protein